MPKYILTFLLALALLTASDPTPGFTSAPLDPQVFAAGDQSALRNERTSDLVISMPVHQETETTTILSPTAIFTPTLYGISNADGDGNYLVDWNNALELRRVLKRDSVNKFMAEIKKQAEIESEFQ